MHVCASKHMGIFSMKSFSLGNLSLLTNFQKLSTDTVSRDGQLIWLRDYFEATFSK